MQAHKKLVSDFMVAGQQPIHEKPNISDRNLREFRKNLIAEELRETLEAIAEKNKLKLLDGICDSLYVLYGALLSFGIGIDSKHNYQLAEDEILLKHITEAERDEIKKTIPDEKFWVSETAPWYVKEKTYAKPNVENWWKLTTEMFHFNEILLNHLRVHYLLLNGIPDPDIDRVSKATRGIEHALILSIDNLYRMSKALDLDVDKSFQIVHNCNMSKFCTTKADAEESIRQYATKSEPVKTEYVESELDGVKIYIIKNSETGKVLKSHLWTKPEPQLSELLESTSELTQEKKKPEPEPEPKPISKPEKKLAKKSDSESDSDSDSDASSKPKSKSKAKPEPPKIKSKPAPKSKKKNSDSDSD